MSAYGVALFDTAIGYCGIAWSGRGIAGVQLPQADAQTARVRLLSRFPLSPETRPAGNEQRAIDGIVALLRREHADLALIALDMEDVPPFARRVYEITRALGPGDTMTYGEIALRMGLPGAARAVGQALGHNPFPLIVPCHRVLAAHGKAGGFSAYGGVTTKFRILALEDRRWEPEPTLFETM
ncbi:MAG TPA: methylated-DNA--[protein]-cysteine S-methyltransferase [Candidatus Baltobacteraceae bacterium]|nr:methylated-DNA--[protein]-cysteine S-methyltransferase [Candidatus Baltobacteraceae bacterium]